MTDSLNIDDLPQGTDVTRRDQWGRYKVVPPGGGKPIGYTRVTTVAKVLDDGGGLVAWKAAMCASGLLMRPGLRARWEALIAETDGDPWYHSINSKAECKKLVEESAKAGGSGDRAEVGTSLHAITAMVDAGRTPKHLSPDTERDVNAYIAGLAAAGVTVVPGMIEVTVVLDDDKVCGTADRLVNVPGFSKPLIGDLKTGADLTYSWQSIACQLAAYSRANNIYIQGVAADGSQDERLPMPEVEQRFGLIMWLNAGTGSLELHLVDLEAGWEAYHHSLWTKEWRTTKTLDAPLDMITLEARADEPLVAALTASLAEHGIVPCEVCGMADALLCKCGAPPPAVVDYPVDEVRAWLAERIKVIGALPAARKDMGDRWPADLPFLHKFPDHTREQLDAIESLCDDVEARHSVPFGPSKPGSVGGVGRLLQMFPGSEIVEES